MNNLTRLFGVERKQIKSTYPVLLFMWELSTVSIFIRI